MDALSIPGYEIIGDRFDFCIPKIIYKEKENEVMLYLKCRLDDAGGIEILDPDPMTVEEIQEDMEFTNTITKYTEMIGPLNDFLSSIKVIVYDLPDIAYAIKIPEGVTIWNCQCYHIPGASYIISHANSGYGTTAFKDYVNNKIRDMIQEVTKRIDDIRHNYIEVVYLKLDPYNRYKPDK